MIQFIETNSYKSTNLITKDDLIFIPSFEVPAEEEAPATEEAEVLDLEGRTRSYSNDSVLSDASTVLAPEGELQVNPVEQKIAKGGVKINENIGVKR